MEVKTAGGFVLTVDGEPEDQAPPASWTLTGDARLLTRVEVLGGADAGAESRG